MAASTSIPAVIAAVTLAARLDEGKLLTPRLVDKALAEFEGMIALIPSLEPGVIKDALLRTQIAWEFERMRETS